VPVTVPIPKLFRIFLRKTDAAARRPVYSAAPPNSSDLNPVTPGRCGIATYPRLWAQHIKQIGGMSAPQGRKCVVFASQQAWPAARPPDGRGARAQFARFCPRDPAAPLDCASNREELAGAPRAILHAATFCRKLHPLAWPMRTVVRHEPRPTRSSHIRHELRQLSNNLRVGRVFVEEQQYRCV
jgi:hypothetical protein